MPTKKKQAKSSNNARTAAARCLANILNKKQSLSTALPQQLTQLNNPDEHALTQELCYGVMRWGLQLQAIAKPLLRKPFKKKDTDIYCLILMGLYQIEHMRIPPHAIVDETVKAANQLGKSWAKALINAILRAHLRTKNAEPKQTSAPTHPDWLCQRIQQDWPEQAAAIMAANDQRPPMALRINTRICPRDDYLEQCQQHGISAKALTTNPYGILLDSPVDVYQLPGFKDDGIVTVQDSAAQLAATLLKLAPGQNVLDACAAPGGKTTHILEVEPNLSQLTAVDNQATRLDQVKENLQRLRLDAKLITGDATQPQQWHDGTLFDRILLDAPCSATGVIRRHPDIKFLRQNDDIEALAIKQHQMLNALWPLLKTGGILLYATCSILRAENDQQIAQFLAEHDDAKENIIQATWGQAMAVGRQILPGDDAMDGFYYAQLEKTAPQ